MEEFCWATWMMHESCHKRQHTEEEVYSRRVPGMKGLRSRMNIPRAHEWTSVPEYNEIIDRLFSVWDNSPSSQEDWKPVSPPPLPSPPLPVSHFAGARSGVACGGRAAGPAWTCEDGARTGLHPRDPSGRFPSPPQRRATA
eukprot:766137-Hanusia_phi.AAC.2